ncbi:type II secretion system minor pseudopilin GspK [Marinomonas sp. 15G1-11]|uniref:Type II secretion system protein K n=1 Tax=Marinomonas phaeophyticola TaxID=3004091 RepID=A0ABT4JTL2_9GAMM|nr:type II secretion system minor pseudopilin GspK [Marinomonas sp. 15G1-11]MCZ2721541.1 type II secretion system minor pseudopilin GspK [Marinomonas sp. 15G1-11]
MKRKKLLSSQRGVALIMALMVFALVSAMAASVMSYLAKERDVIAQVQETVQLKQQLLGGEAWSIHAFLQLNESSLTSFDRSKWLIEQKTFPLEEEGDEMTVILLDRQTCFNVNLLANEESAEQGYQQLKRLFSNLNQDEKLADQVKDWLDADQNITGAAGREDEFYQAFSPSFRTADHALVSESTMPLWQWDQDQLSILLPWMCLWPQAMGTNVNRFPETLQKALLPDMTAEQKQTLNARLDSAGFNNVKDFIGQESVADHNLKEADWRTNMAYVDAFIKVTLGERQMSLHSRLIKSNDGDVRVYGRSYGPNEWLLSYFDLPNTDLADDELEAN